MSALITMLKVETKLLLREPTTVFFGVLFPSALLLGLSTIPVLRERPAELGGLRAIDVWAPTALLFGIVMIAVQHTPVVIATYRERGILRRLSTTPVHPRRILLAQMIVSFISVIVGAVLMIVVAWAVLDIGPPERPVAFAIAFLVGYAAVLGLSLIVAALVRTSSAATTIGTLLFIALMFFGGAFLPRYTMPDPLQKAGDFVPPGLQAFIEAWSPAAGELTSVGQPFWAQVAIMAGIAVVTSTVAAMLFRWE